jgi:hypothetical protein
MQNLLAGLLGFFISVTILLVLLENCSFNVGCGGKNRRMERFSNINEGCCGGMEDFTNAGCGCGGDEY